MSGPDPDLSGFTVGVTADRRGEDQAVMFRRWGAEVVLGPMLQTVSVPDPDELRRRTEQIIADPPEYLIANTGLGIRTWLAFTDEAGLSDRLLATLANTRIAARGPKAAGAVARAGLDVWWRSPSEQLDDVVAHLLTEGVRGRRVVFQLHGEERQDVNQRLQDAGADVVELPVYRWTEPDQSGRAVRLIEMCCAREIDAVTFTAGPQVHNMVELAEARGQGAELVDALNRDVLVGCIGPVCASAAKEEGVTEYVIPDNWRLGSLVRVVGEALARRR